MFKRIRNFILIMNDIFIINLSQRLIEIRINNFFFWIKLRGKTRDKK
jgi:hypothetical protein